MPRIASLTSRSLTGFGIASIPQVPLTGPGAPNTFSSFSTGFNDIVLKIAEQPDGKILVGGRFTSYNGTAGVNYFARLNADGTLDTAFQSNLGVGFNFWVRAIVVQSDGKILVGGHFNQFQSVTTNFIIRLNSDGTRDTGFSIGTGFDSIVSDIGLVEGGRIVVAGSFSNYQSGSWPGIVRLLSGGSVDSTFQASTGFGLTQRPDKIAIQGDGKIIAIGPFSTYRGASVGRIVRINFDGTYDSTYTASLDNATTANRCDIFIQSDGKAVVGGEFTKRIVRFNTNGTVDNTFAVGAGIDGFDNWVGAVAPVGDGKILVGGNLTAFNGTAVKNIIRLNSDGTLDTGFNTGTGFNSPVYDIKVMGDTNILVGGEFTSYAGQTQGRITRLYNGDYLRFINAFNQTSPTLIDIGSISGVTINRELTHSSNTNGSLEFDRTMAIGALAIPLGLFDVPYTIEFWFRLAEGGSSSNYFVSHAVPSSTVGRSQNAFNNYLPTTGQINTVFSRDASQSSQVQATGGGLPSAGVWYYSYMEFWSTGGNQTIDRVTTQIFNATEIRTHQLSNLGGGAANDYRIYSGGSTPDGTPPNVTIGLGTLISPGFGTPSTVGVKGNLSAVRISSGRRYNGAVITPPTTLDFSGALFIIKP